MLPPLIARRARKPLLLAVLTLGLLGAVLAHPLGNFTINHFTRITTGVDRVQLHYVVDLAEFPTAQELQKADANRDGIFAEDERQAYLVQVTPDYVAGLKLTADGAPVTLQLTSKTISLGQGAAGLATMRLVYELTGQSPATSVAPHWHFENANLAERAGWRELIVTPQAGVKVFNSTLYGNGVTDELQAYPEDMLMAPLNERSGDWSATRGALPATAKLLTLRDGKPLIVTRDRFAELIAVERLTPGLVLLSLLLAFIWGGAHALTPGHSKTVVGAYLVGARGTAKHAAYLGLMTTLTHTVMVYVLGLVLLFVSRSEQVFRFTQFISGALIVSIGLRLFTKRLRTLLGAPDHDHAHEAADHSHSHDQQHGHSHLPLGADGAPVTWRSLLALGAAGGLMPCPSAVILMAGAASLNRVGYGLALITAFSLGLAVVLTGVGLAFVYGGKLLERAPRAGRLLRILPAASALIIAAVGAVFCYQALTQMSFRFSELWHGQLETSSKTSAAAILSLGLFIGLRHALDTDHLAAVSTIVSERKNLFGSLLIGGLWGLGHTASLLLAGVGVILLNVQIEKYEKPLEFAVALMLIGLGANVLYKLARGGKIHLHQHTHGGHTHVHPHLHDGAPEPPHSHHGLKLGIRPLVIGMVHGLAGSAALMLAVLATIKSTALAFAYIIIFGLGSIGGMMVMSLLLSLPLHFTAKHFARTHWALRALAGCFSLGVGLFMAYEIGFVEGLLR